MRRGAIEKMRQELDGLEASESSEQAWFSKVEKGQVCVRLALIGGVDVESL